MQPEYSRWKAVSASNARKKMHVYQTVSLILMFRSACVVVDSLWLIMKLFG